MSGPQPRTLTDTCGCPRHEMTLGVFETFHVVGECQKPLVADHKLRQVSDSKPCPRTDVDCPQGMVLEVDYQDANLDELEVPRRRYRCQDCDLYEMVITPEDLWSALALGGGEPPKPDGTNAEEITEWNRLMELAQPALEGDAP